ncbi:MAG: AAA family ATPase [Gammaproteobacteria bacterium]|nr:AAA family ATPase [Gammaproteobacteria bacterium]MXY89227.1 AAA family ATPase [Gammaproteobacteria bacterium]MYE29680.1 AAA family ATPase [Gammaproteobacteria bacterium]MYG95433.1 AAA family ATPase [Gammaproteobacteria bacterium]
MKIKSLKISNFRGIPDLELTFNDKVNVFVGVNGAGKSSILDCAAILLSRFIWRIRTSAGTGRMFTEADINNSAFETQNEIEISFREELISWSVTKTKRGRKQQTITRLGELKEQIDRLRADFLSDENIELPLAVYYPVNRAVLDIPLRIRKQHKFDRMAAYDEALSGKWSSFRIFFEWFRIREDLENERRVEKPRYRDPQLEAVRKAVEGFLPGFTDLKVKRAPLRMIVHKNGKELIVNQLSDGEKCTLALVGDLARRMAVANPQVLEPLSSDAVVLIDELDLHLHPAWQRKVINNLTRIFKKTQFIVSTHSPQILSHLKSEYIWKLEPKSSGIKVSQPGDVYGLTTNRILEDVLDVPARPQEVQEELDKIFQAIGRGNLKKADRLLSSLESRVHGDDDLVKASVLLHRKKVIDKL